MRPVGRRRARRDGGRRRREALPAGHRDVGDQECDEQARQDRDVQREEAGERLVAVLRAAHQELLGVRADHRHAAHDIGDDLGRPVPLLVPGELISRVSEPDREDQEDHAEPPGELAGPAIGADPEHLEQVECQERDRGLRGVVVDAPDEPSEPHLIIDVIHAAPGGRGRRAIRRHQEQARECLDEEDRGQRRAGDMPPARTAGDRPLPREAAPFPRRSDHRASR